MSDQEDVRLNNSINVLHTLIDIIPSPEKETRQFKDVSHDELCKALKFWLDHTKLFFGEVTQIDVIQGPNDAGIDVYIDLLKSPPIKFAIQVKSHGDIKIGKQSLSEKVHSQINRSHKHNLRKLIVTFAGDMTDSKQNNKVNYVTSDIHQMKGNNDYILLISPAQLVTIYNTYKNNSNPLDFINFNLQNSIMLASGLSRAFSNERRKAKVSINLEYPKEKGEENGLKINFTYKLKEDELKLLSRMESLKENDEIIIKKDQLQDFNIYEGEKKIFSGTEGDLIIKGESKLCKINFQTLNGSEILSTLNDVPYSISNDGDTVIFHLMDEEQPLRIHLSFSNGKLNFSFDLEDYRSDPLKLLGVLNFIKSFPNANQMKITIKNRINKEIPFPFPDKIRNIQVDDGHYALAEKLAYIQDKTGYILRLPKDSTITLEEIKTIYFIAKAIESGEIGNLDFTCELELHRVQALNMLKDLRNGKRDFSKGYELPPYNVLGRDVRLGTGIIYSNEVSCDQDIEHLYRNIERSAEEMVTLKLKGKGKCILDWFRQENN